MEAMEASGRIRALSGGRANPPRAGAQNMRALLEADESSNSDGLWREPRIEKEVREAGTKWLQGIFRAIKRSRS
jgi:hypothetical protein